MVINGNRITLYSDETYLQPTPENSFIVYNFNQLQNQYTEGLFVARGTYNRIKQVFHDFDEIHIEVKP